MDAVFAAVRDGRVDYDAIRSQDLDEALKGVAEADLDGLAGANRYAFLLNAYNLCVLGLVRRLRIKSLRNPLRWLRFFVFARVVVAGKKMSLYGLEFRLIKPHLRRDPRGHFALVCASTGCPPLRDGRYHGSSLEGELELAGRAALQPGGGYTLDRSAGTLHVTKILKWYARDFSTIGDTLAVVCRFGAKDDAAWIEENRPRIRWKPYDWSLNEA